MSRFVSVSVLQQREYTRIELVRDEKTGQKALAKSVSMNADCRILQAFRMEVDVLSTVHDPGIPALLDVFEEDGRCTLVESWLEGTDLNGWLSRHPSRKERKQAAGQLLRILEKIHEAGYLYLDLKPENIRICQGQLFLIDFNAVIRKYQKRVFLSTAGVQAPELAGDQPKTEAADIYPLGPLLKRILHGRWSLEPFQAPPDRRLQDIPQVRRWLRRRKTIQTVTGGLTLSVFLAAALLLPGFSGPPRQDSQTIIAEFQTQAEEADSEAVLLSWINSGRISQEDLEQEETACFLIRQAVNTGSVSICSWLQERLPEDFEEKQPALYLLLESVSHSLELDGALLDAAVRKTAVQPEKEQALILILSLALYGGILLDEEDLLQEMMEEVHSSRTNPLFLEYMIQSAQAGDSRLNFPEEWLSNRSAEEKDLWNVWREHVN